MTVREPSRYVLPLLALLTVGVTSAEAQAGKSKDETKIYKVGIESFDSVFTEVNDLNQRLISAETALKTGRSSLNTALDLKKGTPFKDALAELQSEAQGKIKMVMNGNTPTLELSDAVPSNIANAVTALNTSLSSYATAVNDLASIPSEAKQLTEKCKSFPKEFRKELVSFDLANLSKNWKKAKKIKHNLEVTAGIPSRTTSVVGRLNENVTLVADTFGGVLPSGMFDSGKNKSGKNKSGKTKTKTKTKKK